MSIHENLFGLAPPGVASLPGLSSTRADSLHDAHWHRPAARSGRPRLMPQDLVSLLFRQRARARVAALPRVMVHVSVFTPSGRPAVQISL